MGYHKNSIVQVIGGVWQEWGVHFDISRQHATFPEFHLNNLVLMYKAKCLKSYPSDHIDFLSPPVPGHLLCAISNPETVEIRSDHGIARISVSFQRTSLSLPKSILTTISHSEEHYLPKTALFQLRTVWSYSPMIQTMLYSQMSIHWQVSWSQDTVRHFHRRCHRALPTASSKVISLELQLLKLSHFSGATVCTYMDNDSNGWKYVIHSRVMTWEDPSEGDSRERWDKKLRLGWKLLATIRVKSSRVGSWLGGIHAQITVISITETMHITHS
jgi:hypothetical protein